jgi:peptide/nickel transport system permease protein
MLKHLPSGLGIGLALMAIIAALAVFAGVVAPVDPLRTGATPLQPPSSHHLLGTDELGRDLWSNIAYGARASLLVGVLAAVLSTATGVAVGVAAGYYGRAVDEALMRFAEVFQIVPGMLVALLLVAFFGGRLWTLIPVIAFTGWPLTARVVRSEVLSLREREFVLEARALGGRDAHIISRHLVPNAFPAVLIGLPLQVGRAILLEAGLSFLGLGDPGAASWGKLLQSAQEYMRDAWWLALFPGVALTVTVLALYLVAEELHARTTPLLASKHRGLLERARDHVGPASPPAPEAGLP